MRFIAFLAAYLVMLVVALVATPVLPFLKEKRIGGINNDEYKEVGWKLPSYLSWFDTPDNALTGDDAHKTRYSNPEGWWAMVCWLIRNPLYGFKWTVLGCPMGDKPVIKRFSWLYTKGCYFQLYVVSKKFGWILDAYYERQNNEPKAIFVIWS